MRMRHPGLAHLVMILAVLGGAPAALAQEKNPDRNAYFGETPHPHELVGGRLDLR